MVYAPVGIKCPECAGQPTGVRRATVRARVAAGEGTGALVTKALIAVNVVLFLAQSVQGGIPASEIYQRGALYGPLVAGGDWWRLATSGFLHASVLHVGFNMLLLWWFGGPLESYLGRIRFAAIYAVSILAGAAGALLVAPTQPVVGASGAVFGILGAGLVLERRGTHIFGGSALAVVLLNLALGFIVPNVSIGGHLGGLVGGIASMFVLTSFGGNAAYGRLDLPRIAGLVGVAVASVAIAYARVRGYA